MESDRALEVLFDLIRIDSPSREEGALAAHLVGLFEESGIDARIDDTASVTGSDTGNVIAELAGDIGFTIVLSAHMDNVDPCRGVEPVIVEGRVCSAGDTVLGADDKVGVAAAVELMRRAAESARPRPTLRAVFTVQEEIGLGGAKAVDPTDVACDLCLVLDSDGAPGTVVVGAPFHHTFKARFSGNAAHAGVCPEKGVSAIAMAADAVSSMTLGRIDAHTTANVGTIVGGSADNVVAARCDLTGECRSLSRDRALEVRASLDSALRSAADRFGGSVEVEWTLEYDGFHRLDDDPLVDIVRAACVRAGLTFRTHLSGGGSDANILAGKGVPVLVLGTGMSGFHTIDESLDPADLADLVRLLESVCDEVVERAKGE